MSVRRGAFGVPWAALQGGYYASTGLWPLVSIGSFVAVTGPKEDLWLVQTVGALVLAIGAALLVAAVTRDLGATAGTLGAASALAFLLVDVVFFALGRIGAIYLADAAAQAVLLAGWLVWWLTSGTTRAAAG